MAASKVGLSTDWNTRSPIEPVSTWMWSMIWQLVAPPGAHSLIDT